MININKLPNILELPNTEKNFRVFAGPGAGKTTWLIDHLKRVLKESNRLSKTRKIACITYTNVAVEEIFNKLDCDKSRFDISTIHSFLYRNIVKPFSHLIAEDVNGEKLFNIDKLDGHDEHIPHSDRIRRWKVTIEQLNGKNYNYFNFSENKAKMIAELSSLDYSFVDKNLELIYRQNRGFSIPRKNGELWIYKKKYWVDGIMHHEDVLYFAYLIINRSPRVLEFVRNKFPYIFIDEFQDTTELQTWIIEKIAEERTKVGVIGDLAQSIYKFAGAKRCDFENLKINDLQSYKLEKNHRSTQKIIHFLNCLRDDICQECSECTIEGCSVNILIGPIKDAIQWIEKNNYNPIYVLTRKNESVEEIKMQRNLIADDLLKKLYAIDSNYYRVKALHSIFMGYKFYEKGYLKDAIKEVLKPLKYEGRGSITKLELRKIAIDIIDDIKTIETRNKNLFEYYSELLDNISTIYKLKIGAKLTNRASAKSFYESTLISDILRFIKVDTKSEDTIRTIHSSKGTQFDNILVHFENLRDFEKYVFEAKDRLESDEDDARIYYVGFSRAKETLFINIPEINNSSITKIQNFKIEYKILPESK
ncbi:ATP-dependent helicase [uncultured Desulfosarcina sp.]|uniref:ATP-dependent helicase n=1 Tax=uncultured Desulfosarcina sp. TaxID=218289 RepID=UPI0029C8622E|nr:ATP-dependent helicase [uncultured Desulfosarcina sp.]